MSKITQRMSKRLQVILQDPEYREIQRVARSRRMSIAGAPEGAYGQYGEEARDRSTRRAMRISRRRYRSHARRVEAGYIAGSHP